MPRPRGGEPVRLAKRDGSDCWYLEWYDPARGRVRKRSTGTSDRREGEVARARFLLERPEPAAADPAPDPVVTVADALAHYYERHASGLPSAVQARIARDHLAAHFGALPVAGLDAQA